MSRVTLTDLVQTLTPAMRDALRTRQEDLLGDRAVVCGHGMTVRALRARGIVTGAMPRAIVTPVGREVLDLDPTITGEPA
jgi:broad specificity phosphatase PhoE